MYVSAMDITYFGHSSFRLKGKSATVVTDPYDERVGRFPKDTEANIVTISHDHEDHNQIDKVKGSPFVIRGPGEYEVSGVSVIGIHSFHDNESGASRGTNTIYVIEMDGLRVCHLGDLGHKLTNEQLEEMGPIDIVMVPVGGVYTIDAKTAVEVTKQADPRVVIPMHYQATETRLSEELGKVDEFLKEMGVTQPVLQAKYSITTDKLPSELQVVVMERKS